MRRLIFCLVIQVGWFPLTLSGNDTETADQLPQSPDETQVIQRVLEQVNAGREEIVSAEIHFRWHLSTYKNPENTPQRVRELLSQADLTNNPGALESLVKELKPYPALTGPVWESRDFSKLGVKRRAETAHGTTELVDGDHEMTYHQFNEQLTVSGRGGSSVHRTQMEDFRSFPPSEFGVENYRVETHAGGQINLAFYRDPTNASDGSVADYYTIDELTGVVTHELTHFRGELKKEIWQHGLTEYSGGVTLPALRLKTTYREGMLKSLTIWAIESANLNVPVDEDRFIMPVPEDTVLVDARLPTKVVRKVKKPVDDVRSILTPITLAEPSETGSGGVSWRLLLIFNGFVFLALAVWFWKKGSLNAPTSTRAQHGRS